MALSSNADISVNSDNWQNSIRNMKTNQQAMQDYADEMKKIIRNVLAEQGFTGEIADAIVSNYEETVLKEHLKLNDSFGEQIAMHENSEREFEQATSEALEIAKNF